MSARLNHQHAAYAWRREQENNRVQATHQVNRYYGHWGQVTSRFENWTNKEYYDNADKRMQHKKNQQQKDQELAERRSKLRKLLDSDTEAFELELGGRRGQRHASGDLKTLERINQSLKEQEQLKRKLEMEAKLYGRWRHGVDDEKLLYKSKSDNEVLAKLNWLDKQIEQQQQREQQEALSAERQLQLQQEINRTEQAQKERQLIREQEIKDIRALQETHVSELKQRQEQADKLKEEEQHFRLFLTELEKEKQLLEESTAMMLHRPDVSQAYNLKKIKIFIRNRSDAVRKQITLCINLLERMVKYAVKTEELKQQLDKCKEQLQLELVAYNQIEAMYESEAKSNLQRCEENWREQHLERFSQINRIIEQEQQLLSDMLRENVTEQQSLIELRSTHLSGIEQTTKQLEQLNKEQELMSPRQSESSNLMLNQVASTASVDLCDSVDQLVPKVSDSFTNLNLDVWENMPPARGGIDSPRLSNTRSMNVVTSKTAMPPKFARKRVAWT
ncbi:trichoplein keratin filament-binding protein [Drosophila sulfurigaster albostrigata]|uniref:trichoplein keratin filament-binding protein n=1 Tax=Drosophila sulfurigaster albostrigata TaxID=89887 RepID=UPI002D21B605|nr:trichoplein keratin filament-binding protein [Drosophila sulfurigaster albostrigata]XP_062126995.1 trichoplein keratin filament-binding protein [Drosophila sulfurigaster albostrigata]XP_062126996.1 trichoplein keratin filament-binding protein [Drosophila sulfurigaster albostrigata]